MSKGGTLDPALGVRGTNLGSSRLSLSHDWTNKNYVLQNTGGRRCSIEYVVPSSAAPASYSPAVAKSGSTPDVKVAESAMDASSGLPAERAGSGGPSLAGAPLEAGVVVTS